MLPDEPTAPGASLPRPHSAADRLADQSQLDFDIEFFDQVLLRDPDFVDVLRCQGQLLSRKGLHVRAVEIDRRLVRLLPTDGIAHYNLACSLALSQRRREALHELRQALAHGYDDLEFLETDSDLDCLRDDPDYAELLRRHRRGK